MNTVVYGNKFRASVMLCVGLIVGWGAGTVLGMLGMNKPLTWNQFTEEFTGFHLGGIVLGVLIAGGLNRHVKYGIHITDQAKLHPNRKNTTKKGTQT